MDIYCFSGNRADGIASVHCHLCELAGMNPAERLGGNCPLDHEEYGGNVICASFQDRVADEQHSPFEMKAPAAGTARAMQELDTLGGQRFAAPKSLYSDLVI